MESIGGIIWAIIIFSVVISNINKAKKKAGTSTQGKTVKRAEKPTPMEEFLNTTGSEPAKPTVARPTVAKPTSSRYVPSGSLPGTGSLQGSLQGSLPIPEGVDPCHEHELRGPDLKPTIYGTTRTPYTGSLAANTGEGIDPCHGEQADFMTVLETEDVSSESSAPALAFNWTGPEIQKAVVMQEILRRR